MTRYLAFLRAINVGGRVAKMERLRAVFTELGFSRVETFITSGNVIFESSSAREETLRKRIEQALEGALAYKVGVFLRTDAEVAEIANHKAYRASDLSGEYAGVYIAFLSAAPDAATQKKLTVAANETDDFKFRGRELYWLCRGRFSDSKFSGARLEKMLGAPVTVRNLTTVGKLAEKYPPKVAR